MQLASVVSSTGRPSICWPQFLTQLAELVTITITLVRISFRVLQVPLSMGYKITRPFRAYCLSVISKDMVQKLNLLLHAQGKGHFRENILC